MALTPLLSRAQSTYCYLTVKISTLTSPAKAYLVSEYGMNTQRVLDSADLKDGIFLLKTMVDEPVRTEVVIDHAGQGLNSLDRAADKRIVYLEKGNILIKGNDSINHATVTGSQINLEYVKYSAAVLSGPEKAMNAVDAEYMTAPAGKKKDTAYISALQAIIKRAWKEKDSLEYVWIMQNPDSWFSLEALRELAADDMDAGKVITVFKGLSPRLRNSQQGMEFSKLIIGDPATAIGAMAPDFTENDVNGHPVKLSDFKGKYVLLDFWASWCGPCRAENPNVVKAFNKYKDRNFTVLGVSLDQPGKKDAWLAAIKKDGLPWTQVSDLKFWDNAAARQYSIRAIPQNFLIDPTGRIIGKNLRGEGLTRRLEELF